jgi:hypothetical protein
MTRQKIRFPLVLAGIVGTLAVAPFGGRAMHAPTSTDDARAVAALGIAELGQAPTPLALPRVTTTDEARLVAGAVRPLPGPGPRARAPAAISTTDEARARGGNCGELAAALAC